MTAEDPLYRVVAEAIDQWTADPLRYQGRATPYIVAAIRRHFALNERAIANEVADAVRLKRDGEVRHYVHAALIAAGLTEEPT